MKDTKVYFTINPMLADAAFYKNVDSAFAHVEFHPYVSHPEGEPMPKPTALAGFKKPEGYSLERVPWEKRGERHEHVADIISHYSPTEEGEPRVFRLKVRYQEPETISEILITTEISKSFFDEIPEQDAFLRLQAAAWELHRTLPAISTRCVWQDTRAGVMPDILRFEFSAEHNVFLSASFDWAEGKDPDTWEIPPFVLYPWET